MVFVNDKKYACETCIKGHRSSTCNHTERPLFEIKKKGRPITQCEHCRELRKTKQVHVKCLCEGRGDADAISHSIPAKKANRKGPTPSAAFPFGLQAASAPVSDSEDATHGRIKTKAAQRSGSLPPCACKKGSGPCNCCTPRHASRAKRSLTPPTSRPRIGDIRATASPLHRASSDAGDGQDGHSLGEAGPHALSHGHGARPTHGSALFTPYGHAHDAHLRAHDVRGLEALSNSSLDASNGYIYPVPPISYSQQQAFGTGSEASPAWPNGERRSDDIPNAPSSYDTQRPEGPSDMYGAVNFASVDVDAWLQEIMVSSSNPSPTETDVTSSSNIPYTEPPADVQTLPVPQALDVSQELSQTQDSDFMSASSQYDLLPRLGNIDLDYNDSYLSGSDQDPTDAKGLGSTAGMFDSDLFNCGPAVARAGHKSGPFSNVSDPFSNSSPSSQPPPMLTVQSCSGASFPYPTAPAVAEPRPQEFAFDLLSQMLDTDYVVRPPPGLPALTRSPSIGSHSSSLSRSSFWARNGSTDCLNANSNSDEQWHTASDNTSYPGVPGAEHTWNLSAFPSVGETAREWPASRVHAYVPERGQAARSMDVPRAKNGGADIHPLSFN